jgi:hypothetical protein
MISLLVDSPLAQRVRSGGAPHAPLVVAHSAAAPAGRGPESPLASSWLCMACAAASSSARARSPPLGDPPVGDPSADPEAPEDTDTSLAANHAWGVLSGQWRAHSGWR